MLLLSSSPGPNRAYRQPLVNLDLKPESETPLNKIEMLLERER